MILVKIRHQEDLFRLFDIDFSPATSPVTELLKTGESLVIDTSLEVSDLNNFTRTHAFTVPVFDILSECCKCAGVTTDNIYWLTPVAEYEANHKYTFNGTLLEYHNSAKPTVNFRTGADMHFLSLNNYPRPHREKLVEFLEASGIKDKSLYSYNPQGVQNQRSVVLDEQFTTGNKLDKLDSVPAYVWEATLVSIVTETIFADPIVFPTEKTWKVFDKFHFPVFVSCAGFVNKIRELGFDVFDDYIDHSYDTIEDNNERLAAVFRVIEDLSKLDIGELNHIKSLCQKRLIHNKMHLRRHTTDEIMKLDMYLATLKHVVTHI